MQGRFKGEQRADVSLARRTAERSLRGKSVSRRDRARGAPYIFVGGAPRSGTTLLQNILDSHPDICGIPEFKSLQKIVELCNRMHYDVENRMTDLICTDDDIDASIRRFIAGFFDPLLDKHEAKLLSEKTPQNILVFSELLRLFPQAHFIHMVRDPRATTASLFRVGDNARRLNIAPPAYTDTLGYTTQFIQEYLRSGFDATSQFPDRVLVVTYKRLVTETEVETKRICEFLGIEWSEQMLRPADMSHISEAGMTCEHNRIWYDKSQFNRDIETDSLERWKQTLSSAQQIAVARAFEDWQELAELGYDFTLQYLSGPQRVLGTIVMFLKRTLINFCAFGRRILEGVGRRLPGK